MSRGFGSVQRGIMTALHEFGALDSFELAVQVYFRGKSPWWVRRWHEVAIRPALIGLLQQKRVRRLRRRRIRARPAYQDPTDSRRRRPLWSLNRATLKRKNLCPKSD